ncbi:zinc ribbon domain-containing protein [bacterium]|nr:zinc ribbon domain-containing protein [bacterium]
MSENVQYPSEILTPACVEFLANINRFHAGQMSSDDFAAVIEERRKGLKLALTQFLPNLPLSENPQGAERQRGSIKILEAALKDIETAIPQMLDFADDPQEEKYRELMERIGRIWTCERVAIEQYHQAFVPDGPTDMPLVNSVYHAQKAYYRHEIPEASYIKVIDKVLDNLHNSYKEIDERTSYDPEAKSELLHTYSQFAKALETVKASVAEGEDYANGLMQDVVESAKLMSEALTRYTFHANTGGPTRMLQANLMINMATAWQQGRLEASVFLRALDIFAENLDRNWRQIQAITSLPNDREEQIAEYMDILRAAYEEQFRAVELFRQGVGGDEEALKQAYDVMASGAEKAAEGRDALVAMGENVGKVPCMHCGTFNAAGSRKCSNCGSRLLASDALDMNMSSTISFQEEGGQARMDGGELIVTPQLSQLFGAVDAVTEGRISKEAFAEAIDTYRSFMARTYHVDEIVDRLMQEAPDTNGDLPQIAEEVGGDLQASVQAVNDGLDTLDRYVGETNSRYILDGLLPIRDGMIKLQGTMARLKTILEGSSRTEGDGEVPSAMSDMLFDGGDDMSVGFVG